MEPGICGDSKTLLDVIAVSFAQVTDRRTGCGGARYRMSGTVLHVDCLEGQAELVRRTRQAIEAIGPVQAASPDDLVRVSTAHSIGRARI
jgi:hypothetical protein